MKSPGFGSQSYVLPTMRTWDIFILTSIAWVKWRFTHSLTLLSVKYAKIKQSHLTHTHTHIQSLPSVSWQVKIFSSYHRVVLRIWGTWKTCMNFIVTLQSRELLLKYHDGLKMHLGRPVKSWAFHKADTEGTDSPSKAKIGLTYWIQRCIGSDLWTRPSQVSFVSCNSLTCIPATVGIGGLQNLPGAELCSVAPLLINIQCFLSSYKTKPLLKSVLQTFTPRHRICLPSPAFTCVSAKWPIHHL